MHQRVKCQTSITKLFWSATNVSAKHRLRIEQFLKSSTSQSSLHVLFKLVKRLSISRVLTSGPNCTYGIPQAKRSSWRWRHSSSEGLSAHFWFTMFAAWKVSAHLINGMSRFSRTLTPKLLLCFSETSVIKITERFLTTWLCNTLLRGILVLWRCLLKQDLVLTKRSVGS